MSGTARYGAYGTPASDDGRGEFPALPPWLRKFDIRPVWIGLTVLGFIAFWPIGLALLLFLLWSGRMGCGFRRRYRGGSDMRWGRWAGSCRDEAAAPPSSGNRAFDAYRADTLRRLEEEQREFAAFLERLRVAKDKAEFDAFMAERRRPTEPPAAGPIPE